MKSFMSVMRVLCLLAVCCVPWSGQAWAATVSLVQSGTAVSSGNGTLSVTLGQAVNPATSVLFFSTRHAVPAPPDAAVRGRLVNADTIEFVRVTNNSEDINISWYLVEFASGVQVQRGQVTQNNNTLDVNLAQPVASVAQSFLLYSKTPLAGDTEWGSNDPIGGYLRNTSSIRFRAEASSGHVVDYQVVEFTDPADILVQSGETNVSGTATTIDVNLSQTVNPANTFVLAGHTINSGGTDIETRLLRAEVVDGDTVRFTREASGNDVGWIVWQVIELRDGSTVQHGTQSFGLWNQSNTVNLATPVDPNRAVAFSGMQSFGGQSMGSAHYEWFGNIPGVSSFTFDLTANQLQIDRDTRFGPVDVGWFVVEFNEVPPGPVLDVAMNEPQWSGTAGEVVDQVAGNNGTSRGGAVTQGAAPAIAGNPGTCRYGDFDGSNDYLSFPDAAHLDMSDALTVAIWINARVIPSSGLKSIVSKDTNYEFHVDDAGRIYWWWNASNGAIRSFTSTAAVSTNTWHHVAITYASGSQIIYLDGVPVGSTSYTGTLATNGLELQVGQDQNAGGRFWDGYLDELKIYDRTLSAGEIQTVMNETRPCSQAVGEWRFDEPVWNGTAGEVLDSSGNAHHGTAANTTTSVGLLCQAADLGAGGTTDYLQLDATAFDGLTDLTLAAWYRGTDSNEMTLVSGANASEDDELTYYFRRPDRFDPWLRGSAGPDVQVGASIDDGNWHFLAWTREDDRNCLYVDGALEGCRDRQAGAVDIDAGGIIIGQRQSSLGGGFASDEALDGELDEMILFNRVLSGAELTAIRGNNLAGLNWDGSARSCPTAGPTGFVVGHDGTGIHCAAENVQVSAVDAFNAVVTGYAGQITLDTGTGSGTWSLVTGNGTLVDATADDGLATYQFDPADNGTATFALYYPQGTAAVDVDVHQSDDVTLSDNDAEGLLTFAPSGFTLTANALPNPPPDPIADPIPTQVAGGDATSPFAVHITAYGTTPTDAQCGVIESYTGSHDLTFGMAHLNPGGGTRVASVNGQPVGGGSQAVAFTAGQAQVTVSYKDAGRIRLDVTDTTSFPNALAGSTNPFVVQPAALVVSRVQSGTGVNNPGAGSATGPAFVPAGQAFAVDVEARDADGDLTPNYGQESAAEGVTVSLSAVTVPAGGSGMVSNGAAFVASGVPGRFTNSGVVFDDVGVIRLVPAVADGDYLGSGPVPGTVSGSVGRFHPAVFDLATSSVTAGCGTFTYMSQPALGLQYRLRALNAAGDVTPNYDLALLADPAAVADVSHVAEAANSGIDLGARLSPVGGAWTGGQVVVNRPDLIFSRGGAPDGPHDPLQLGVVVTDTLDGVPLQGLDLNAATTGDCVAAGNCSARSLGTPTRVIYGRLAVLPTSGPENLDLPVPLAAQAFTGAAFEHNTADACSTYTSAGVSLAGYTGNLAAGETAVVAPLAPAMLTGGAADPVNPPTLSAPNFGNDGSVQVILDVPAWLEFDWLGAGTTDPAATATFGSFRGHDRIIYWGEPH